MHHKYNYKIYYLLFICMYGINISSGTCGTCFENQTYIWGVDGNLRVIPNTLSTCWGIISCGYAQCGILGIDDVIYAVMQISNNTLSTELDTIKYNIPGTCSEGKSELIGLNSNYQMVPKSSQTCWGLLSCSNRMCAIKDIPGVSFVGIMTTHGN